MTDALVTRNAIRTITICWCTWNVFLTVTIRVRRRLKSPDVSLHMCSANGRSYTATNRDSICKTSTVKLKQMTKLYRVLFYLETISICFCLHVYSIKVAHSTDHPHTWCSSGGKWQKIVARHSKDPIYKF